MRGVRATPLQLWLCFVAVSLPLPLSLSLGQHTTNADNIVAPSWEGVVAAGASSNVALPASCETPVVVFQPTGSDPAIVVNSTTGGLAAAVAPSLHASLPGDYIIDCAAGDRLRYVAVAVAKSPGRRASYVLVNDSELGSGSQHTNSRFQFWATKRIQVCVFGWVCVRFVDPSLPASLSDCLSLCLPVCPFGLIICLVLLVQTH